MKDEGKQKRFHFILHPSAFILPATRARHCFLPAASARKKSLAFIAAGANLARALASPES